MCLLPPSWYGGRIDLVTVILRFDAPGNRSHTPLCGLLEHAESHKLPLRLRSILRDQCVNDTYRYLGKTQRKAVGWLEQVTDADYQKLPLVLGLRAAHAIKMVSTTCP